MNNDLADKIHRTIPRTAIHRKNGWPILVVPLEEDTVMTLRSFGVDTTYMEPYHYRYNPPLIEGVYTPMAHQALTSAFLASLPRAFCTNTMRTGKTGSVTTAVDYLHSVKGVNGACLIVCTVSNMTGVWQRTIKETLPHKKVVVLHGGTGRSARLRQLEQDADYYIINYDGVKLISDELYRYVACGKIRIAVIDELTHYGSVKTQRWKAMNSVVNGKVPVEYCWGLTGSPGANTLAIFGFVKLINPTAMPCRREGSWREMVQYRYGTGTWMWRDKREAPDIIRKVMQPTIRFTKEDIMDLPPVVHQYRNCVLTKEQKKAYEHMREHLIAETADGKMIEAVHKASKVQKILQIACGSVIGEGGDILHLDNSERLKTLIEIIKEAERKVVIFSAFTAVIERLVIQLEQVGWTVGMVNGSVSAKKRTALFHAFQNNIDPQILVCHPETTAFGVELAAADMMIFNGPPRSGGFVYEQALERLSSLKQKASQIMIVKYYATKEELQAFKDLDGGVSMSDSTNKLFAMLVDRV